MAASRSSAHLTLGRLGGGGSSSSLPRPRQIGRFQIRDRLARGTFGCVFRAYDPVLDREVALKVLAPGALSSPAMVERFLHEAQMAAELQHPHLVSVYYAGRDHNRYYLAAALIEGHTLAQSLAMGVFPYRQAVQLVLQLAEALAYVHDRDLVHGAVKPGNILLDAEGMAYLAGLRPETPFVSDRCNLLETFFDAPACLPPEQMGGGSRVLPTSDQYGLGAVLYELLCGQPPFRHSADPVPPPQSLNPHVPRELEKICLKALARRPRDRYPSCQALADCLRAWLTPAHRRVERVKPLTRWVGPRPAQTVQAIVGLGCLAIALVLMLGPMRSNVSVVPAAESVAMAAPARVALPSLLETIQRQRTVRFPASKTPEPLFLSRPPRSFLKKPELLPPPAPSVIVPVLPVSVPEVEVVRAAPAQPLAGGTLTVDLACLGSGDDKGRYEFRTHPGDPWQTLADSRLILPALALGPLALEIRARNHEGSISPTLKRTWMVQDANPWAAWSETILPRGGGEIRAVAFDPQSKVLASAGVDHKIRLWDLDTKKEKAVLGCTGPVWSVAFSPDGRILAASSEARQSVDVVRGEVRLWDLATGKEKTRISHPLPVRAVAFSPDGRLLASASEDRTIKLWDLAESREKATLKGHSHVVVCVAFSPDGKLLATGSLDRSVKLWDPETGQEKTTLSGYGEAVTALAFSPDGKLLATGSRDRTVCLWEVTKAGMKTVLVGHAGPVRSVAFSADGQTLVSAGADHSIREWDVATGRERTRLSSFLGDIDCVACSPDGKMLAAGGSDGVVHLWDGASRRDRLLLKTDKGSVVACELGYAPDSTTLAAIITRGKPFGVRKTSLQFWNPATGQPNARPLELPPAALTAIALSIDSRLLALGMLDPDDRTTGVVQLWEIGTGKPLAMLLKHLEPIRGAAFSPDGHLLATGTEDGTVTLWDVASGQKRAMVKGHLSAVPVLAFSPDGRTLATGSEDLTVTLWDVPSDLKRVTALLGQKGVPTGLMFSPDGHTLATRSEDGTVRLCRPFPDDPQPGRGGDLLISLSRAMAFSPDGRTLALGGNDGTIRLWDLVADRPLATFKEHTSAIISLAFSPDGQTLSTTGSDGMVKLWRATLLEDETRSGN